MESTLRDKILLYIARKCTLTRRHLLRFSLPCLYLRSVDTKPRVTPAPHLGRPCPSHPPPALPVQLSGPHGPLGELGAGGVRDLGTALGRPPGEAHREKCKTGRIGGSRGEGEPTPADIAVAAIVRLGNSDEGGGNGCGNYGRDDEGYQRCRPDQAIPGDNL